MITPPTPRRLGIVALVAGLMVLAGGCFAAEMNLTINDNDADIAYTLLVDVESLGELSEIVGSELPDLSALSGEALIDEILEGEDPCAELRTALPGRDIETTEVNDGGRRGVRCNITGVPFAELGDLGDGTTVTVTRDGGTTTVAIDLDGIDDLTADTEGLGADIGLAFQDLYEILFVVTAQGTLGEHNATSTDGATATWLITPDASFIEGGTARLRATWTGDSDGGGGTGVVIIVITVVVLAVAAGAFVLMRRRSTAKAGSPLPPPPPPPPPSGPPAAL